MPRKRAWYWTQWGNIIGIDSEYLHIEAIKPTLTLRRDKAFAGAEKAGKPRSCEI
jgi:hypothetical protein